MSAQLDLRCDCRKETLLGVFNVGDDGQVFLEIKSWKQQKMLVHSKIYGRVEMFCRNCQRWTGVNPKRVAPEEISGH